MKAHRPPAPTYGGATLLALCMASAVGCGLARAQAIATWEQSPLRDIGAHASGDLAAQALIAETLARLPTEPLTLTGRLIVRRPRGMVSKTFGFRIDLHWGGDPPTARYTIMTEDGAVLEQVIARGGAAPELVRTVGPEAEPAPSPDWNARIQGSDVTWLDATLAFLWWRDPRLVGEERVRGRLCDIVELTPTVPVPDCARMRVWLDREHKLLMQAAEIDPQGHITRQLWVRAVKKTQDRWMVRDLEVQMRGSGHRTRLHITSLDGETMH